jgi:hypothetical protein
MYGRHSRSPFDFAQGRISNTLRSVDKHFHERAAEPQIPRLRSPGFPVEGGGVDKLRAPLFAESRIRRRFQQLGCRKSGSGWQRGGWCFQGEQLLNGSATLPLASAPKARRAGPPNVSPARKGWDIKWRMIPSAVGAAPFCFCYGPHTCLITNLFESQGARGWMPGRRIHPPFHTHART